MIDQEGGLVKRLPGPPNASAEEMGKRGKRYSALQGVKTAESLKRFGVNVNLAPVLDVGRRGSAIRAEHRSFGSKPGRVIDTAIPFAIGMQGHGIAATGKHFPASAPRSRTPMSPCRRSSCRARSSARSTSAPTGRSPSSGETW